MMTNMGSRWRGAAMLVALVTVAAGCAHRILMEPTETRLGSSVATSTGQLAGVRSTFHTSDPQVVAWVEFANAYGDNTVRFRWLNERDEVVQDTGPVPVAPPGKMLHAYRRVWSILPVHGAPAELMPGKWRVEAYFNKKKFETLKFTIKEG